MRLLCCSFLSVALVASLAAAQGVAQPALQNGARKQGLLWEKLEASIAREEQQLDAVVGVALLDLTDGRVLLHNGDEVFPVASSIKVAVLAELYRQAEQSARGVRGKAKLSDAYTMNAADVVAGSDIMAGLTPDVTRVTNRDLATFMVAVSDNAATNVLIDRLGMENINALLASLDLKETRLRRRMMDLRAAAEGRENTSTPREMSMLFEAIYRNRLFGKALTDDLFKLLSTHKESYIARSLPGDAVVADKPGNLEGVRTDSGIIFLRNRPFVISVMTTFARDERAAETTISRIAAIAYDYFDRLDRASPYGRVISPR